MNCRGRNLYLVQKNCQIRDNPICQAAALSTDEKACIAVRSIRRLERLTFNQRVLGSSPSVLTTSNP